MEEIVEVEEINSTTHNVIVAAFIPKEGLNQLKEKMKKHGVTLKFKNIKRNDKEEITAITINAKSSHSNASYSVDASDPIKPIKISTSDNGNNLSIETVNTKVVQGLHLDPTHKFELNEPVKVIGFKTTDYKYKLPNLVSRSISKSLIATTTGVDGLLYMVDGQPYSVTQVNELNQNNIESMSVLKDASATTKYGDKGKNGVIEVTTKKKK